MSIKRIFIVISAIFAASAVFADNSSVTSKKYVDDLMSGYQGKLPGSGANTLMIYDDETGIGEKAIETTLVSNAIGVPTVSAVKTGLDGKQDTITGTAGYVMTGMGTNRPGEVGERAIYSANTSYSNALVTAETVNTGVINAVNSSLIRVDANGDPDPNGTLWEIADTVVALSYYTQLEYIESDGTQFIDTGYMPTNTSGIKIVIDDTATNSPKASTAAYFVGSALQGSYMGYFTRTSAENIASVWAWNGEGGLGNNITSTHSTVYINYMNDRKFIYNNGTRDYVRAGDLPILKNANGSLYLFSTSSGGGAYRGVGKMYSAQITENQSIVRNLVPAQRNSDGVVGMYDTVSGTFFPDAAGGNFIAGPAVAGN